VLNEVLTNSYNYIGELHNQGLDYLIINLNASPNVDEILDCIFEFACLNFDVGSFNLNDENKSIIKRIAEIHNNKQLQIVAYTDWVGDDDYNNKLTASRAEAVKKEFMLKGFPESNILIFSKGKMISKQDKLPAKECRRVEIRY